MVNVASQNILKIQPLQEVPRLQPERHQGHPITGSKMTSHLGGSCGLVAVTLMAHSWGLGALITPPERRGMEGTLHHLRTVCSEAAKAAEK